MTSLSAVNSRNLPVLSKDMAEKKLGQNDFLRLMTTQLKEQDPFNPVGRGDCLETAALMVMAGHLLPEHAYESVSSAVRTLLGLPAAGVQVGAAADFVLLPAASTREAIAAAPSGRTVIRAGIVVHP